MYLGWDRPVFTRSIFFTIIHVLLVRVHTMARDRDHGQFSPSIILLMYKRSILLRHVALAGNLNWFNF